MAVNGGALCRRARGPAGEFSLGKTFYQKNLEPRLALVPLLIF
jgi:hypothetical protein